MISRRGLLQRMAVLPLVGPVVVKAAATSPKVESLGEKGFDELVGPSVPYVPMNLRPLAERVSRFEEEISTWDRPELPRFLGTEYASFQDAVRSTIQWDRWIEQVNASRQYFLIPQEIAAKLAGLNVEDLKEVIL